MKKYIKIKENKLHRKMFASTWMYNGAVEKRYRVIVDIIYVPAGGHFNKSIEVNAYNEYAACLLAEKKVNLRPEDKIYQAEAIAMNIVN